MTPLATASDLTSYGIETTNTLLVDRLLASVSSAVRAAAGSPISRGTWTVTIPSEASRKLDLPSRPVLSVESVSVDGIPVSDWRLYGSALYREKMWSVPSAIPVPVTVTFTAGYEPVPEDIVRLVCTYVAAGLVQQTQGGPGAHRDIAYERVDDAQVGYRQGGDEIVDATELPEATRKSLRSRFGSPGVNVGVFK